jgi:hypothetical protein
MKTIEIYEYGDLINVTITVPRYQTNKSKNGINEKIKLDLPAVRNILRDRYAALEIGICVKNNTLDNRAAETCSATWTFKKPPRSSIRVPREAPEAPATPAEAPAYTDPEAKPEPPKPKKTTRRRSSRKTTKKTETEV